TKTKLYVYDYAAYGELVATLTTSKKTYTVKLTLPDTTVNQNKIADSGWKALQDASTGAVITIPNVGLDPAADEDDNPAAQGEPALDTVGDGLTNLEEYRGFVVKGTRRRLNPFRKDLFVRLDDT